MLHNAVVVFQRRKQEVFLLVVVQMIVFTIFICSRLFYTHITDERVSPYLVSIGNQNITLDALSWEELEKLHPQVRSGQSSYALDLVVVVPYRRRARHLKVLLKVLHFLLPRQELRYRIVVVEMAEPTQFNRALLLNIGVVEARKLYDVSCYVFHDVDLIPLDAQTNYSCDQRFPKHLSVAIDTFNFTLPWTNLFGGVTAMTWEQFSSVNGFSNIYFGWGGEDDDLYRRVLSVNMNITRDPPLQARYIMLKHTQDPGNEVNDRRYAFREDAVRRMRQDGLSSLRYSVDRLEYRPLYTWLLVTVTQADQASMLKDGEVRNSDRPL